MEKTYPGDQWTLGEAKDSSVGNFWDWAKVDGTDADGEPVSGEEHFNDFKQELWFKLEKIMWIKSWQNFQDHVKYILNAIVKPFMVSILHYDKRVREMHELAK